MPHQMTVLFLCADNGDRSQMAAAMLNHEDGVSFRAVSAGLEAADGICTEIRDALHEIGVDLDGTRPATVTQELAHRVDRVIALGEDVVSHCPDGISFHEAWAIPPMHGQPMENIRAIRDQIRQKVRQLARTA